MRGPPATRLAVCVLTASILRVFWRHTPPLAHPPDATGQDGPAFSLGVTPTRLVVPAGQLELPQYVRVSNTGPESMQVDVGKRDFTQSPDGTLTFQPHAPYSASDWVRVDPPRFDLAPGASRQVEVRVSVPDQPDAGDHQVALVFLVAAPPGPANIRVNRGVGLPVFVTVPGPVDDSVRLDDLRAPGFALGGPLRLSATLHSVGTVHRDFRESGALGVKVAGRTVAFPDFTVTRGAVREVSTVWNDPPLACVCRATITVTGPDGVAQVRSARIVVVPVHLIGAVLGGVLLLFVARLVRRHYRARARTEALAVRSTGDA